MIQLNELTLKNYAIHRSLKLTFGAGVTGIVGDNGSGKSSIIQAIKFLFTGEVARGSKQECITLGETEGWVSGKFLLNEKEAYLERHLSASKVILKYDGVSYNKAAEVRDMWFKLLQIDASIFNNVIVAGQGEIPMLFSGDDSVREKVFQKIFLVPPTEKLRSTIWDHYIKNCPPEKFEEDINLLQSEEAGVATRRNKLLYDTDQMVATILTDTFLKCVIERIAFLERCQRDLQEKPKLETQAALLQAQLEQEQDQLDQERAAIAGMDLENLKQTYNRMLAQKNLASHKEALEIDLIKFKAALPTEAELVASRATVANMLKAKTEVHEALSQLNFTYSRAQEETRRLSELKGQAFCPTCLQELTDTASAIQHQHDEMALAQRDVATANAKYTLLNKQYTRAASELSLVEGQYHRMLSIEQQLSRYADVTYSKEELTLLGEAVQVYEKAVVLINRLELSIQKIKGALAVNQERLKNLALYDGEETIAEELETMQAVILENRTRAEELANLRVQQAKLEHELQLLEQRIETSLINHKANEKRRDYLEKMQKAYDVLHVSKFPRKLIESYSEHVQVHLSSYLDKFSIPYKARIAEGFKIKMINADNQELPSISGGQEVIVGICLRLALHKMFAQSFPIWIVDEGTTHLSENKRKAYFRLIDDIRTNKVVNQVIIIDHDSQLSRVVDRTIEL